MEAFQAVSDECCLSDVDIRERLDRGVTDSWWLGLFPMATIQYLLHYFFDHFPLLVQLEERCKVLSRRNFRFEAWWVLVESFEGEVEKL